MHDLHGQVRAHQDAHMETVERQTYDCHLRKPFTAHPKIDPVTGEAVCTFACLRQQCQKGEDASSGVSGNWPLERSFSPALQRII